MSFPEPTRTRVSVMAEDILPALLLNAEYFFGSKGYTPELAVRHAFQLAQALVAEEQKRREAGTKGEDLD